MQPRDLVSLQPFYGLTEADAESICSKLRELSFGPNDVILQEGDGTQALWMVLSGEVTVSRNHDEQERILAVLNAGDLFGEMSFVRQAPHSASIIAVQSVKVACFDRQDFLTLAAHRPDAGIQILSNIAAVLSERLRRMDTWVCDLFERPDSEVYRDEWQVFRSAVYTNWEF